MNKNSQQYFDIIDSIAGGEGERFIISPDGEEPLISVVCYRDNPEPGEITSFSWGLSSKTRPEWIHARPEFMLSVKSADTSWGQCMGEIIYQLGSEGRVGYGTIFNFKEQICDESEMTSFFTFASSLLLGDEAKIELPDRIVHLAQLYPIYESEVAVIQRVGIEHFFFKMGIDFSDVKRRPVK